MEQALTDGAAGAVPSTLELLLGAGVVSVKANMPTARYEISRLSEAAGAPVVFTLRALPYAQTPDGGSRHPDSAGGLRGTGPEGGGSAGEVPGRDTGRDRQGHAAAGRDRRSGHCSGKAVWLPADHH